MPLFLHQHPHILAVLMTILPTPSSQADEESKSVRVCHLCHPNVAHPTPCVWVCACYGIFVVAYRKDEGRAVRFEVEEQSMMPERRSEDRQKKEHTIPCSCSNPIIHFSFLLLTLSHPPSIAHSFPNLLRFAVQIHNSDHPMMMMPRSVLAANRS